MLKRSIPCNSGSHSFTHLSAQAVAKCMTTCAWACPSTFCPHYIQSMWWISSHPSSVFIIYIYVCVNCKFFSCELVNLLVAFKKNHFYVPRRWKHNYSRCFVHLFVRPSHYLVRQITLKLLLPFRSNLVHR